MNDTQTTSPAGECSGGPEPTAPLPRKVMIGVSVALGFVVLAPVLLSSQDLYRWGRTGLGLPVYWAWLVPVALDCAAAACIGMAIVATWRRERPGMFGILVWVFAGTSAWAQYRHGVSVIPLAPDAYWAFPAFALLGPMLLHFVMGRLRKWARQDAGEQQTGAAGFGSSWIPGVAFTETRRAWAASRREGINSAADARAYVRQVAALRGMSGPDAVRYACDALHGADPYAVRVWLQARRVSVTQADLDAALVHPAPTAGTPRSVRRTAGTAIPGTSGTAAVGTRPTVAAVRPSVPDDAAVPDALGTLARSDALFAVQQAYPDWRQTYRDTGRLPSVRTCAKLAGKKGTSAGQAIQRDLVKIFDDEQLATLAPAVPGDDQ